MLMRRDASILVSPVAFDFDPSFSLVDRMELFAVCLDDLNWSERDPSSGDASSSAQASSSK